VEIFLCLELCSLFKQPQGAVFTESKKALSVFAERAFLYGNGFVI